MEKEKKKTINFKRMHGFAKLKDKANYDTEYQKWGNSKAAPVPTGDRGTKAVQDGEAPRERADPGDLQRPDDTLRSQLCH